MPHKFRLRELVRFAHFSRIDNRSSGEVYEIIRLMPEDQTGEPTYRIKSAASERAVRESEIAALT
jgi:hypothetical protein